MKKKIDDDDTATGPIIRNPWGPEAFWISGFSDTKASKDVNN